MAVHTATANPAIISTMVRVCSVIFLETLLWRCSILLSSPPIFVDGPATSLEISPRRLTNYAATAVNCASAWSNFAVIDVDGALKSSLVAS